MKKRRKGTDTIKLDLNAFEVRIDKKKIEIETKAKKWKVVFSSETGEYVQFLNLLMSGEEEDRESFIMLCRIMYSVSTYLIHDADTVPEFLDLFDTSAQRIIARSKGDEDEDEDIILAEEKAKHIPTDENILEVERLKEEKKKCQKKG